MRNPEAINPSTLPNRKCQWKSVEEEQEARQAAVEAQLKVLRALFPGLLEKFARIGDPRRPGSIRHKHTMLLVFGILLFLFQYDSRREANRELTRPGIMEVLRAAFPEIERAPHLDTLARFLERIKPEELENILGATIRKLLRSKKLQALLVSKRYVVAFDGTQKLASTIPFAPEVLHRRGKGGQEDYYVYVLEAAIVGPQGVTIPLLAEFCENQVNEDNGADNEDSQEKQKQDCELKAFRRLAGRLKELLNKQRLMIVADGLYPNGPVMSICRANNWDFMIVLPAKCLPSVWADAEGIHTLEPKQSLNNKWGNRQQEFWWANDIDYGWRDTEGRYHRQLINVVVCNETWQEKGETRRTTWAWVSYASFNGKNVLNRCNRAARHRWGIEENFLTEKTRGYNYEHGFSYNWTGLKGWHALMRLAHLINTLTLLSVALWDTVRTLGKRGTLSFLRETIGGRWLDISRLVMLRDKPPQLRLVI